MRIQLEGTLLRFTPESDREKEELNQLWNVVVDCARQNRKLVPVGNYVPGIQDAAVFNIEENV